MSYITCCAQRQGCPSSWCYDYNWCTYPSFSNIAGKTTDIQFLVVLVAYALIILFGISAIVVIYLNLIGQGPRDKIIRFSLFVWRTDFLILFLSSVYFFFLTCFVLGYEMLIRSQDNYLTKGLTSE